MTTSPDAFTLIVAMLRRSFGEAPSFPPTELFSEGWMLRLLLEAGHSGHGGLPFTVEKDAGWYSEARLASPFLPRSRGDAFAEGYTQADGVIGHFSFRDSTTAGLALVPTATQFVVVEAKMGSTLAGGTSKVAWFDQAARNVAAMAWTVHTSRIRVSQLASLAFFVFVPRYRITEERTFTDYLSPEGIADKIGRRIDLYAGSSDMVARLGDFRDSTLPQVLERITVRVVAWEDLLDTVDAVLQPTLREFYAECLRHNQARRPTNTGEP